MRRRSRSAQSRRPGRRAAFCASPALRQADCSWRNAACSHRGQPASPQSPRWRRQLSLLSTTPAGRDSDSLLEPRCAPPYQSPMPQEAAGSAVLLDGYCCPKGEKQRPQTSQAKSQYCTQQFNMAPFSSLVLDWLITPPPAAAVADRLLFRARRDRRHASASNRRRPVYGQAHAAAPTFQVNSVNEHREPHFVQQALACRL